MRAQKVYVERPAHESLDPDRVYAATARFYVTLKNERNFDLDVLIKAFDRLFIQKPWEDEYVSIRSSDFQAPQKYAYKYNGSFTYSDEKEPYYFELFAIPRLKKGQLLALEKWAESFAKALLYEEILDMVISSSRAEVSFRRMFGTFRR